jgi:outer membrane protein OmpA-like peptidoglycan-associated protein
LPTVAPDVIHGVIGSPGKPLDPDVAAAMSARFEHDFSGVRVHTDREAATSARAVNARAYAVGQHIVFGSGQYQPQREVGRRLLAHELVHVLQQGPLPRPFPTRLPITEVGEAEARQVVALTTADTRLPGLTMRPSALMRDVDDPTRFETVHRNIFVEAPGVGRAQRQAWTDAAASQVTQQFRDALQQLVDGRPMSVMGRVSVRTTEQAAEQDAERANQRVLATYPYIPRLLSRTEIETAVTVLSPGQTPGENFVKQWLANRLIKWTDIEDYDIGEGDPAYDQFLTDLVRDQRPFDFAAALQTLRTIIENQVSDPAQRPAYFRVHQQQVANKTWSWVLTTIAGRVGAYAEAGRRVLFSPGIREEARRLTLIHELIHFYTHADFSRWIEQASAHRYYVEGFTEYLARQVMTEDERSQRNQYQARVEAVEQEVAAYIPLDDIARAYFLGEVWRVEGVSAVAQERFTAATGIASTATRAEEVEASRAGPGIVQTVSRGRRYRFMNLGVGSAEPQPEHRAALQTIISEVLAEHPAAHLRFVGHASSPGSASFNLRLARRRSRAFYDLARELGMPGEQLIDAANPPAEGERTPTAGNESTFGRALNRRVEMYVSEG